MTGPIEGSDAGAGLPEWIGDGGNGDREFRAGLPDDPKEYLRTVVAFSNGNGGRILFGVGDDGTVIGIPDDSLFATMDAIEDSVASFCRPRISLEIGIVDTGGRNVIVVHIWPGSETPYHLESEGKTRGTYIRIAGTSRVADPEHIKSLELRGNAVSFDRLMNTRIAVDGETLRKLCSRLSMYGRDITPEKLVGMEVLTEGPSGYMATNAYAMLTKNPFSYVRVQCACFRDPKGLVFADSAEYGDDLVSQVTDSVNFVMKHMIMSSEITGLFRKDTYDLPEAAVREAIVNAVMHRDYSLVSSSIMVRVFEDRVEVESPGLSLVGMHQMLSGLSKMRNPAISSVFKAMNLIERFGTGIRRMIDACEELGCRTPEFTENYDNFKVVLYRLPRHPPEDPTPGADGAELRILRFIGANPTCTLTEISESTGIPMTTLRRHMDRMRDEGVLSREGSRKTGRWVVNDG